MRKLSYAQAINEGLTQALELSPDVVFVGQVINRSPGLFGTTEGIHARFGSERVHDFPAAESVMTSVGMGLALAGKRPVLMHHRLDFTLYAMDAVVNWLSLWRLKSNGAANLPVVIRAVVGKNWGQGPQHSKSLHGWYAHLPGFKVAMPATSYDAKGLLLESIFGEDPVLILEARSLYSMTNHVPEEPYRVKFGHAAIRRRGDDATIVTIGNMLPPALKAADLLQKKGIHAEVIDLRTVSPIDTKTIFASVGRTRRLVVADPAWHTAGVAAEISALATEQLFGTLAAAPVRITLPDSHTPMSAPCEAHFYPTEKEIAAAVEKLVSVR